MENKQTPSVGRSVHYLSYGTPGGEYKSVARAAIITVVHDDNTVGLVILSPKGLLFDERVSYGDKPGHWQWMPYVPSKSYQAPSQPADPKLVEFGKAVFAELAEKQAVSEAAIANYLKAKQEQHDDERHAERSLDV